MTALYKPQIGDIGLTQINGDVGKLIRFGQWLNGSGFQDYQHAFVVADVQEDYNDQVWIVEAEPGGAQYVKLHYDPAKIHWCTNLSKGLDEAARERVAQAAMKYVGVPYSFLDYFSLAVRRLELPGSGLFEHRVRTLKHQICSQLAARAYFDAKEAFYDGWTGNVVPLDLLRLDNAAL